MTTARDVANQLNISVSTVGRALADDPRISQETKQRVRKASEELGYVANRAARMMRGVPSTLVGIVVPDVRNSFYATAAHGLTETLGQHGHQVVLSETGDDRLAELRQLRDLASVQVAGVVIVPTPRPHPEVKQLLKTLPYVQFNRRVPGLSSPWFGIDDHDVTNIATKHLLGLGHRRIGFIGGTEDLPTGADRLAGFRDAIAEAGLPPEFGLAELGRPAQPTHAEKALRKLLRIIDPPTAIVTASVQMTIGLLTAAHEDQIKVPDDLSVVGFGDEPGFTWWGPGLTTMELPVHDLASACGSWLLHHLNSDNGREWKTTLSTASRGRLLTRGSTAAPSR